MIDMRARELLGKNDWVTLFHYLNRQSVEQMCYILEDLQSIGFKPLTMKADHPKEWGEASPGEDRMMAAALCVAEKFLRNINFGQFKDANQGRLGRMPGDQVGELEKFWRAGPVPGLKGDFQGTALPTPAEFWTVTDLSVDSASATVRIVGVAAMTGKITFRSSSGAEVTRSIGLVGLTAGWSSTSLSSIPGFDTITKSKFPRLFAYFSSESKSLITRGLDALMRAASPAIARIGNSVLVESALKFMTNLAGNVSGGGASWTSRTTGVAVPVNHRASLVSSDFSGVVMIGALQGSAAVVAGGLLYMRFGASTFANSFGNMHGMAMISTVGLAAQWPQLGATGAVFFGEIV